MTTLGVYWAPGHQRTSDIEYMQRLQPPAIRVLDPDPNQLVIANRAAPNALLLPRDWALSEQHDDVRRDPTGTGKRHAQDWRQKINNWRANGVQLPPDSQIIVVGINEPRVWDMLPQVVEYNVAMLDECTRLNVRACALNLSVGWPANTGPGKPPDWTPYAPIEAAIKRGSHFLVLHEYFYRTGPRDGWGWYAGRLQHCPWQVPIIIGECGIDMYVDMPRWEADGKPNRGWRGNVDANTYAGQIEDYARAIDKRVVAILPFLTDYRSNNWESFDTAEAHGPLLARKDNMIPQAAPPKSTTTYLPEIISDAPTPPPPPPVKVPQLTHPIADATKRIISQRFGENPQDYAKFGMAGHTGIDYAVPEGTKVVAVDDGLVIESRFDADGYGEYVKVKHRWGESLYAHLAGRSVAAGASVYPGHPVGLSGNTGNSTGPHLHLGIRINPYQRGAPFDGYSDPLPYLSTPPVEKPKPITQVGLTAKGVIYASAIVNDFDWPLLASLAWAESSWREKAVSDAGALGILQIMPATWAEWAPRVDPPATDPLNDAQNLSVGIAYLKWLLSQTNGNVWKALVAYNFGIGNVLSGAPIPDESAEFANKVLHGRDLLNAVGAK